MKKSVINCNSFRELTSETDVRRNLARFQRAQSTAPENYNYDWESDESK